MALFPGKTNRVQAIISWQTDEPSTSQIFYETGAGTEAKEKLNEETALDLALTTKHLVVLTKWQPGQVYRFRVASQDVSGNPGTSKDFFVMTPQKKATVLDLIIENFSQTFGWVEKLGF